MIPCSATLSPVRHAILSRIYKIAKLHVLSNKLTIIHNASWKTKLYQLAKKIENLLYQNSTSLKVYADETTLLERVHQLIFMICCQLAQKLDTPTPISTNIDSSIPKVDPRNLIRPTTIHSLKKAIKRKRIATKHLLTLNGTEDSLVVLSSQVTDVFQISGVFGSLKQLGITTFFNPDQNLSKDAQAEHLGQHCLESEKAISYLAKRLKEGAFPGLQKLMIFHQIFCSTTMNGFAELIDSVTKGTHQLLDLQFVGNHILQNKISSLSELHNSEKTRQISLHFSGNNILSF